MKPLSWRRRHHRFLPRPMSGFLLMVVLLTTTVGRMDSAQAASLDTYHVLGGSELPQAEVIGESQSQSVTSDGTLPFRLLAVGMAGLAALLGALTFWYWKATVPPARRGYAPEPSSTTDFGVGPDTTDPPMDQME